MQQDQQMGEDKMFTKHPFGITLALMAIVFGTALAQTGGVTLPVRPQEFQTLSTASYALSPVQDSGVSGSLQITERAEGGTRLTVTLAGAGSGRHALVLHAGDCGPDRPAVLRLQDVGAPGTEPDASVTDSSLSFATLSQGDYFLYVYAGEPGSRLLACGEVGQGANP
ncbi:MAG TPA: hypothetical protein VF171_03750 [Trueperaceae bacterium]